MTFGIFMSDDEYRWWAMCDWLASWYDEDILWAPPHSFRGAMFGYSA